MRRIMVSHSVRAKAAEPAVALLVLVLLAAWPQGGRATEYVGSEACRGCHQAEYGAWQGSHHDLAMQPANADTVLGNFEDQAFEHRGVKTRFFRRDGQFMVETQGADGAQHEYQVSYTFGVYPLQQYLIGFPDGRYQALTVAWDSRSGAQGGQRWFHLYPNEDIPPGDELHWTASAHNWNFACAECHSTRLRKNYDAASDSYRTSWAEIDVACEACHGPGARHVASAEAAAEGGEAYPADHGLEVDLGAPGVWRLDEGAGTARLVEPARGAGQVELCGRCHARRSQISEDYVHGRPLADTHRVQLLTAGYYHSDGQILDEVYVYGSFLQSRMHAAGVTCSDCHDAHSLKLKAGGNEVCTACHAPETYDSAGHHRHKTGSAGARCVECHMPSRTYMVVDPRRDHSLRVPRPDLSEALGVPNPCIACHIGRRARWAAETLDAWYGKEREPGHQRYARVLHAAREGDPRAAGGLEALVLDRSAPGIARATALQELAGFLEPSALPALQEGLASSDPLMRRAAVETLQDVDAPSRLRLIAPLLRDPVRDVRLASAVALADVRAEDLDDPEVRSALEQAFEEYLAMERLNADRAEHWVNLAGFHVRQGRVREAEEDYAQARRREPRFVPAYVNQADMYRALDRDDDGERILRAGLKALPEAAALHHALGLLLIRTARPEEALQSLARAHELGPENPRLGYVYGVALENAGQRERAIEVWDAVVERHPNDQETLNVLTMVLYQGGQLQRALVHAEHLATLSPDDPVAQNVLAAIRQQLNRTP
jgi:Flp pilus assembly protein TadD